MSSTLRAIHVVEKKPQNTQKDSTYRKNRSKNRFYHTKGRIKMRMWIGPGAWGLLPGALWRAGEGYIPLSPLFQLPTSTFWWFCCCSRPFLRHLLESGKKDALSRKTGDKKLIFNEEEKTYKLLLWILQYLLLSPVALLGFLQGVDKGSGRVYPAAAPLPLW